MQTSDNIAFWHALDALVAASAVVVDRPRGSRHPRYPESEYPLDYGFLDETRSGDGAGIGVWLGSHERCTVTGIIYTVDLRKRDMEAKLLLGCTHDRIGR
jgi:inorganic pyrophosphatase